MRRAFLGIEIFRGRHLHRPDRATPLRPGKVEAWRFSPPNVDHVSLPGHRLMAQVQSSLFPHHDRKPQTFVDNILFARPIDNRRATRTIRHDAASPAGVYLPIAPWARRPRPARLPAPEPAPRQRL